MAGLIQIEQGIFRQCLWPPESQPWTLFYQIGDIIRERRGAPKDGAGTNTEAPQWRGAYCREEEAGSRMVDEGCPNP